MRQCEHGCNGCENCTDYEGTHPMTTQTTISIVPMAVWIESDMLGSRHVMVQHQIEGEKPFTYASFFYHYGYTSNSGTRMAAEELAKQLGAQEPIEYRDRDVLFMETTPPAQEDGK